MAVRMGRSVPGDISIIGCDDIAMASYSQPTLSTVRIPRDAIGQEAFRMLDKMVTSKSRRGGEAVIATTFIARGSSGAVRRSARRINSSTGSEQPRGLRLMPSLGQAGSLKGKKTR